MLTLLMLGLFGVVVGVLSGVLGVGGGIFMVPFLVIVIGLTQHEAQATSLLVVLPTSIVAAWSLHKRRVVDMRLALRMGAIGTVGSILGTFLALSLPGQVLRVLFAALMVVVGARLLRDAARPPAAARSR